MTEPDRARKGGARKSPGQGLIRSGSGREHDEIVAVDDLVGQPVLELGGLAARNPAQHCRGVPDQPFRERQAGPVDEGGDRT